MPIENQEHDGEMADEATRRRLLQQKKMLIRAAKTKRTLADDDITVISRGERRPMSELLRFASPGEDSDPTDPILTFDRDPTDLAHQTDSDDPEAGTRAAHPRRSMRGARVVTPGGARDR